LCIYKNGIEVLRPFDSLGSGNNASGSGLIYMNGTTDYLDLYAYIAGVGTLGVRGSSDGNIYTYFQGTLVRAA
jgi:hypothetical protein